ncbi:hypothetical protein H5410_004741 [Solanum commersonii]|uniref:Uncharacterized protein n=1 Tax=Solanum commersonii TaxID=4109 RepID=A0A9J6A5F3_SOLCO|nr:hypothetical protein H5410_004741 [Solanum commersonii]
MKKSKVLFYNSSLYSKVIGVSQIFFEAFLVLFVCFLIFRPLRYLRNIRSFSGSYEKKKIFRPFYGIYVILGHFRAVTKRNKVLFYCSSRYSKLRKEVKFCSVIRHKFYGHWCNIRHDILRSLVQVKFFLGDFGIVCVFLNFRPFCGIYVILGHFRVIMKRSKFCSVILHDILRSLMQVKKNLRRFCIVCVCLLIFCNFGAFTSYSSIFGQLRKEVKFCFVIHHNILGSLVQIEIFSRHFL